MKEKIMKVKGIRQGSYLVAEIDNKEDVKRGDGTIIPAHAGYYLHLQYPTYKDGINQLSKCLHRGDKIVKILSRENIKIDKEYCLSPYIPQSHTYTVVWHYKVFKRLGIYA